jgi:hypothetical protein
MKLARAMDIVLEKVCVDAEHYMQAWNIVLAAIEANKIAVDEVFGAYKQTLLHLACHRKDVSVAVVQRLLNLGASSSRATCEGYVAMHEAARGFGHDSLEKCKILPAADLGCRTIHQQTPLHILAHELNFYAYYFCTHYGMVGRINRLEGMLRWMVDAVQCPVDAMDLWGRTAADMLRSAAAAPYASIVHSAAVWKRRWTPQRAAWIAACCKPGRTSSRPPLPPGSSF